MFRKAFRKLYQKLRKTKYYFLSDNKNISGKAILLQPVLFAGRGKIEFRNQVTLGYFPSPFFYDGIIYLEARRKEAWISFGNNVFANNNLTIICEGSSIQIGDDVLIGSNVEIIDSDFHEIHPDRRNGGKHKSRSVIVENNVFIGSNVKILKGVTIGANSVIANGAVVVSSVPKNVIAAGNPAVVIRTIEI